MVNSPSRCGVTEKFTVTVELIAPLIQLMFWEVPACANWRPDTLGVRTRLGEPPSKASESVALSPSVSASRSSVAVNEAAHAAPGSSATISIANVFKVNRILFFVPSDKREAQMFTKN